MTADECYNRVHYTLSDESGQLRFKSFRIQGSAECRPLERELQDYLLGRPFSDLEPARIRHMTCPRGGLCARTIADIVAEQQSLFLAGDPDAEAGNAAGDRRNRGGKTAKGGS